VHLVGITIYQGAGFCECQISGVKFIIAAHYS